jgi:hypothetical protein
MELSKAAASVRRGKFLQPGARRQSGIAMSLGSGNDHERRLTEAELKAKRKAEKKAGKQAAKDQAQRERQMGARRRK